MPLVGRPDNEVQKSLAIGGLLRPRIKVLATTDAPVWSPDQRGKDSQHLIDNGSYNAVGQETTRRRTQAQEFYAACQKPHSNIHKSCAIGGSLRPRIKSAGKFQLDPLSNQRCLSRA
jgi:hypothetical protein